MPRFYVVNESTEDTLGSAESLPDAIRAAQVTTHLRPPPRTTGQFVELVSTGRANLQVGFEVRVRHEVADVAVLQSVERVDGTCCSASSILPG